MRNEIAQLWIQLGIMHNRTLTKPVVDMMLDAVSDLEPEEVCAALKKWAATESRFPLPADLRKKIEPEMNEDDESQEIASLILTFIGKYGSHQPSLARQNMGELSWLVVERMGGWTHLCESVMQDNETFYRAQIRDLAKTLSKRARRGEINEVPQLPEVKTQRIEFTPRGIE